MVMEIMRISRDFSEKLTRTMKKKKILKVFKVKKKKLKHQKKFKQKKKMIY